MKKLYYDKKEYKDLENSLADEIGSLLIGNRRPQHIEVDGSFLKTSLIEIKDDSYIFERKKEGRDLDDPFDREKVLAFERELNEFKENQPQNRKHYSWFLHHKKVITDGKFKKSAADYKDGKMCWGEEREYIDNYAIYNPFLFFEMQDLKTALEKLKMRREYARKKEEESLLSSVKEELSEQLSFPKDEIIVADIPF